MKSAFYLYWPDRVNSLMEAGIDFKGKYVLDAGCNMGIIGYEICKQGVANYHGVDLSEDHVKVARSIFLGVETPSRFDVLELGDRKARRAVLLFGYDVTLYLAVHHHVERTAGRTAAMEAFGDAIARTLKTFVFRGPKNSACETLLTEAGFLKVSDHTHPILHPLTVWQKSP